MHKSTTCQEGGCPIFAILITGRYIFIIISSERMQRNDADSERLGGVRSERVSRLHIVRLWLVQPLGGAVRVMPWTRPTRTSVLMSWWVRYVALSRRRNLALDAGHRFRRRNPFEMSVLSGLRVGASRTVDPGAGGKPVSRASTRQLIRTLACSRGSRIRRRRRAGRRASGCALRTTNSAASWTGRVASRPAPPRCGGGSA